MGQGRVGREQVGVPRNAQEQENKGLRDEVGASRMGARRVGAGRTAASRVTEKCLTARTQESISWCPITMAARTWFDLFGKSIQQLREIEKVLVDEVHAILQNTPTAVQTLRQQMQARF